MTAALSSGLSWLLFLVCVAVGVAVYVVVAGGRRYRRMEVDFLTGTVAPIYRFRPELDAPHVSVFGGIYDHEARGDFDGRWTFDHDPMIDHECEVCDARLRGAFNRLADRPGSPRDADGLMAAIREEFES